MFRTIYNLIYVRLGYLDREKTYYTRFSPSVLIELLRESQNLFITVFAFRIHRDFPILVTRTWTFLDFVVAHPPKSAKISTHHLKLLKSTFSCCAIIFVAS
jgi:hypothetical protein